ncbi:MAG TPA: cysteine methyltransferase, partial [Niabella sp.]
MQQYYFKEMQSPVGRLQLVATDDFLVAVQWMPAGRFDETAVQTENRQHPLLLETEHQLNDYFFNHRQLFTIPFRLTGSDFQRKIWELLPAIPYGKTV